jgi:hypothetical protein
MLGPAHAFSPQPSASTAMPSASATTASAPMSLHSPAFAHPFGQTLPQHAMPRPPASHNHTPGGRAAQRFQQHFQQAALANPGSVKAGRAELGFKPGDLVMLDIGGEGQKTDGEMGLKSGNLHAINVNAQTNISPGNMQLQLEPNGTKASTEGATIPNLVQLPEWPSPKAKATGFLPFADGLSNLTMMEGAPVFDYHVDELARITSRQGWMVLSVSDDFQPKLQELAKKHNGGTLLKLDSGESGGSFSRFVIPPASMSADQLAHCKDRFESANSHDLADIVQSLGPRSAAA